MALKFLFCAIFVALNSFAIWIITNDQISEEHKLLHQDSYAAPGFENVKKLFA